MTQEVKTIDPRKNMCECQDLTIYMGAAKNSIFSSSRNSDVGKKKLFFLMARLLPPPPPP